MPRLADLVRPLVRRAEDAVNVDVLPRRYWSPVPYDLPEGLWDAPRAMPGVEWDLARQVDLYRELEPLMDDDPGGGMLGPEDARVLGAVIRHLRPRRVVELGSGHSTRVIRAAAPGEHLVYDPYPDEKVRATGGVDVVPISANEVPLEIFDSLEPDDVLFVDTSHTVKAGSDVNRIILEILPILRPGVWVHFHDIFLPWEYPREWLENERLFWAEQYLLQAFLAFNPAFRVELALYALTREGRIAPAQPAPGSLWLSRLR